MLEGSYGKEPFDLRLTVLRLFSRLDKILALTLVGTLLFGGGYYVKNVLLQPDLGYAASSTYKVEYVVDPNETGAYYINETSWNTFLHTKEFLDAVQKHLREQAAAGEGLAVELTNEELSATLSATLPSDLRVPVTKVTTELPDKSTSIAHAVETAMVQEFTNGAAEVTAIRVLDPGDKAERIKADVRPGRAFLLSAVLSLLFAVVIFLLKELGDDCIWLPAALSRRYGLKNLGTVHSAEFAENVSYHFAGKTSVAVCTLSGQADPLEVIKKLPDVPGLEWIPIPTPSLSPECVRQLRKMDGILLAVPAGRHVGKPLEYMLEYLSGQDCKVTAALLWEADEKLLKAYYCLPDFREKETA